MNNRERILRYLQSIYPQEVIISEIESATGVTPHAQVYQKTQELLRSGNITGYQAENRTWHFKATSALEEDKSSIEEVEETQEKKEFTSADFELLARRTFSGIFQTELSSGTLPDVPKQWDMLSDNGEIVGDAKYYALVGGTRLPPAKFSNIAEHVWLLDKTDARIKFLVFGNQIEVPKLWLERYGNLVGDIQFYFLNDDGRITILN